MHFHVLRQKYVRDHGKHTDVIELSIKENFMLLGEAFELASSVLDGITDPHHFIWDILEELLTPEKEDDDGDTEN